MYQTMTLLCFYLAFRSFVYLLVFINLYFFKIRDSTIVTFLKQWFTTQTTSAV